MKKRIIICLIVFSCFLLVGCGSKLDKEQFGKLYYTMPVASQKATKDSGTLESDNKWESIRFQIDDISISIMRIENRSLDGVISFNSSLKKKSIQDIEYYYMDKELMEGYRQSQYNTPVGEDMYTISIFYKDTKENKKTINTFMKSVEVKK